MKIDWKDVLIRAVKTFVQAACSATVILLSKGTEDAITVSAIISVAAAGVSAVWNGVVAPLLDKLSKEDNG